MTLHQTVQGLFHCTRLWADNVKIKNVIEYKFAERRNPASLTAMKMRCILFTFGNENTRVYNARHTDRGARYLFLGR
jgi:hypothetical protein